MHGCVCLFVCLSVVRVLDPALTTATTELPHTFDDTPSNMRIGFQPSSSHPILLKRYPRQSGPDTPPESAPVSRLPVHKSNVVADRMRLESLNNSAKLGASNLT